MGKSSNIEWTEATWNPWTGCIKVSPGCKFCYMYRDKDRFKKDPTVVMRSTDNTFNKPLSWKDKLLVFTCSWSDWFIEEADPWREDAWQVIRNTPHIYQILTKRPERIAQCWPSYFDEIKDRVWIGVSVESEKQSFRVSYLRDLPCIKFASFEPLIGPISWQEDFNCLDWMIIGGESGNDVGKWRYRPAEIDWMIDLVNSGQSNNVAVFVKQLGTYLSKQLKLSSRHGGDIDEFPLVLQVRRFPIEL